MNKMKFNFKQILKVSAFYLEKQKVLFLKKIFLSRCQYQNKKALLTDPIFSIGFDLRYAFLWRKSRAPIGDGGGSGVGGTSSAVVT